MFHQNVPANKKKPITRVPNEIMLISKDCKSKKPWKFVMDGPPIDDRGTIARYKPHGMEVPTFIPVFVLEDGNLRQINAEISGTYTVVG